MAFLKTMLSIILLYLFHCTVVKSVSIRPSNLSQDLSAPKDFTFTDPSIPEPGNTSLANTIPLPINDPHISFAIVKGTAKLPMKACLMVALEALVELSFEYFTEPYGSGIFVSSDYPEVIIVTQVFKGPGPIFQTKHAARGLVDLITLMLRQSSYSNSSIIMRWSDFGMSALWASVAFAVGDHVATQGPSRVAPRMETLPQGPYLANFSNNNNGTEVVFVNNDDDELLVFAEYVGGDLAIPDVFITLYSSVFYIAQFPTTDAMVPFGITPENSNAGLQYILLDPPPRSTFVFQNGWAARSLQKLSKYMFEQRKFNEIKFISGWDKTLFSVGSLKKKTMSGARVDVERA